MEWIVRSECGTKAEDLHGTDVKDIFARFFFSSRFRSSDDWKIRVPENNYKLNLPFFRIRGYGSNYSMISDKQLFLEAARTNSIKKKKSFFKKWFSCFFHPSIYLEYERLILNTERNKRYSEIEKRRKKKISSSIKDKTLKISYGRNFLAFCKIRTKFIKCYSETVKPAFFCQGGFAELHPNNPKLSAKIMKIVQKLGGNQTLLKDYKNYEDNKNADPYAAGEKRKSKVSSKSPEEQIEELKKQIRVLQLLEDEDLGVGEIETAIGVTEEEKSKKGKSPKKAEKTEKEPGETEKESEETEETEKESEEPEEPEETEKESEEKKGASFGKALSATATVLRYWKNAKNKDERNEAVKLYKMFESSPKFKKNPRMLHRVMELAMPLF
tara:strand:- start:3288 stop:4439 length:1152 start_codon:yes stop_codon:yes gene_type:complete